MSLPFDPDWRVAPGETIKEIMEERGITEGSLASMTGLRIGTLRALLDGTGRIDDDVAGRLSLALGVSSDFWLNAEANYRKPVKGQTTREGA